MIHRSILGLALAAVLLGCGRDAAEAGRPDLAAGTGGAPAGPAGVLRFPAAGGTARLYAAATLDTAAWRAAAAVPALERVIGPDLEQRFVYALDRKRNLVALELESGRIRTLLPGVHRAAVGPDGSVFALDSARGVTRVLRRTPLRLRGALPGDPTALYGTIGGTLIAVRGGAGGLQTLSPDRAPKEIEFPAGPSTATLWGDLVAVGTDTGIVLYAPSATRDPHRTVEVEAEPAAMAFSPSGHRLYVVSGEAAALEVRNRFDGSLESTVGLPGPAAGLRGDRYGDWLVVRAASGDSAWVVDLAGDSVAARVATRWDTDLPAVAGGTLLVRRGGDVVALDLASGGARETGRVEGGAKDRWVPVGWLPGAPEPAPPGTEPTTDVAAGAEGGASAGGSGGAAADTSASAGQTAGGAVPQRVYLQISSSQNPEWARDLRDQLRQAGLGASVLEPQRDDDPYRVVVGPYPSREAAEEASRKLGRPSFIIAAGERDSVAR